MKTYVCGLQGKYATCKLRKTFGEASFCGGADCPYRQDGEVTVVKDAYWEISDDQTESGKRKNGKVVGFDFDNYMDCGVCKGEGTLVSSMPGGCETCYACYGSGVIYIGDDDE